LNDINYKQIFSLIQLCPSYSLSVYITIKLHLYACCIQINLFIILNTIITSGLNRKIQLIGCSKGSSCYNEEIERILKDKADVSPKMTVETEKIILKFLIHDV
jgi:hypothetical protein